MMSVAEAGYDAGGSGAIPYFKAYLECGLSPFPTMLDKTPPPGFAWGVYRTRKATLPEIDSWDGYNIAVAAGAGSDGRVAFDIDNFNFWTWLRAHEVFLPKIFDKTWVYRSGSGRGGHLWLESVEPIGCSNLTLPSGVKLGEVKGEGGYLIVPPSGHESGGTYTTVHGRPDQILQVPNALVVFQHLVDKYAEFLGLTDCAAGSGGAAQSVKVEHPFGSRVLHPSPDEPWKLRLKSLPSRARRALMEPANYTEGEWVIYPSNSEIMNMIAAAMVRAEWTIDEAEQCFADAPFGQFIYRNIHRPGSYGRAALDYCWVKGERDWIREQAAAKLAMGPGWKITQVKRRDLDDPEYELNFKLEDGRFFVAKVHVRDMVVDKQFVAGVAKSTGWAPELQAGHAGNGIMILFRTICSMAGVEHVAPEATTAGYIESIIKTILIETERHKGPETMGIGWRADGQVFIRSGLLIERVRGRVPNAPNTLDVIWKVMSKMGVKEMGTGAGQMWQIPEAGLGKKKPPSPTP